MISIPYPRISCLKTIPFTAAHTYIIPYNMAVPPPPWESKLLQMTPQNATIDWIPMGQVTRVPPLQSCVPEIIEWVIKTNFSVKTKGKFTFQCNYPCINVIFFSPTSAFEIPVVCQIWPPFPLALWTIQGSNC